MPTDPKPLDTNLAADFANGRVRTTLVLDDGTFRADPAPRTVTPRISQALAFCSLLAGATAENSAVIDAAQSHGMSFGLGVVTVADSVLKTAPQIYLVGGRQRTASLQPYHHRLAWIAIVKPDVRTSCPGMMPTTRPVPQRKTLPDYQILAIDTDTGAAGIIYQAKTNAFCNFPGYRQASVAPAVEFVSVPLDADQTRAGDPGSLHYLSAPSVR